VTLQDLDNVVQLAAGDSHTCALLANTEVRCWGAQVNGRLGDGMVSNGILPNTVSDHQNVLTGVRSIALGDEFSLSLSDRDGDQVPVVNGWGRNTGRVLTHNGATTGFDRPYFVAELLATQSLTAGTGHACGHLQDGRVFCWGNDNPAITDNTDWVAARVLTDLGTVRQIDARAGHTCAVDTQGAVRCWGGNNLYGQLGPFAAPNQAFAAVPLTQNAQHVSAGKNHSCAVLDDGSASCWGDNSWGQIGDGSWAGRAVAPKQVVDLPPVTKIRAGFVHSCALTTVGTVYCWGQNHANQMADGFVMSFDQPQRVDGL
jgi:alpha-tubulin suppressor-like RCC1 family protein